MTMPSVRSFLDIWDNPVDEVSFGFDYNETDTELIITVMVDPQGGPVLKFPLPSLLVGRA